MGIRVKGTPRVMRLRPGPIQTPTPRSIVGSYRYSDGSCSRNIREACKAKAPQALEVLTRCLQSGDDRVAMMAAQAILDRGYGKPTQSIDVREDGPTVRYIVELPEKCATTAEWLESIRREDAGRALVTGVAAAVEDEQTL